MSKRSQKTRTRVAYLAQVLILLEGDSDSEACDALSGLLTHNGIYGKGAGILDWSYRFEGDEYVHLKPVRIPADFEPDTLELHNLSGAEGGAS